MATAVVRTFTRAELRAIQSIPEKCQCASTKTGGKPCSFRPSCQVLFPNSSDPTPSSASDTVQWMCAKHARMAASASATSASASVSATSAPPLAPATRSEIRDDEHENASSPCCSICLDSLVTKPTGAWKRNVRVTTCKHAFHTACIRRWLAKSSATNPNSTGSCPVCRTVVSFAAATNPRNTANASAFASVTNASASSASASRNASALATHTDTNDASESDPAAWYDRMVDIMRANLEPDQVTYVLEVSTIYNLSFFPLTPQAYRGGRWMPAILRD